MGTMETGEKDHGTEPLKGLFQQRLGLLREKLLDLTKRNRLISFKHSDRARTHIRVIDELPDFLFARLSSGKGMRFKPLPEPETEPKDEDSHEFLMELEAARTIDKIYKQGINSLREEEASSQKAQVIERDLRNRVREKLGMQPWVDQSALSKEEFARLHGLEPAYRLPKPMGGGADPDRYLDDEIQTLLFPREMDRKLRGIVDQARTMAQEAGVSTLRAAFGFLEWSEADQSEIRLLSPLVLLPVSIEGKKGRPWRHYDIDGGMSEVETNTTLAIRLDRDFGYDLPSFDEEDTPESYLAKVERSVEPIPNWRVHRFVTIGNFGFSKLAMYTDLDPELWFADGGFGDHDLIGKLLLGENRSDADPFEAPDYDIDSIEIDAMGLLLVTDADASQHSALVDAVRGKNLVIMGPPGTGKSQTITNLIAASMASGKKVLFVAEKMAALEVVSKNLAGAGLSEFFLEVHSSKTSKAQVLESLKNRLEIQNRVPAPSEFMSKLEELRGVRDRLNEYVMALNEHIGSLGLTVHQVFWGERRARDEAGDTWKLVQDVGFNEGPELTSVQRAEKRYSISEGLSRIPELATVGGNLRTHPWSWVGNQQLSPVDLDEAQASVTRWQEAIAALAHLAKEFRERFGPMIRESRNTLSRLAHAASQLPERAEPWVVSLASTMTNEPSVKAVAGFLKDAGMLNGSQVDSPALSELPASGADWLEWQNQVDAALEELRELGDGSEALNDAAEVLSILRGHDDNLGYLQKVALTMSQSADFSGEISVGFARSAMRASQIIEKAPPDLLGRRMRSLFDDGADAVLLRAISKSEELHNQRQALETIFVLSPLPVLADVDGHARALRGAGALGALSSSIWRAKKFFRSIAAQVGRVKTLEMGQLLTRLAAYLDARNALAQDTKLAELCGNWFEGPETRFNLLADVQRWGGEVRSAFPISAIGGADLRNLLLEGEIGTLESIVEQSYKTNSLLDGAWLESLGAEEATLADLCSNSTARIDRLEKAIHTLSQRGFAGDASLTTVAKVAAHMRGLNPWREAVRKALPNNAAQPISLLHVAEALRLVQEFTEADLPFDTVVQMVSGDSPTNFSYLREWANHVKTALGRDDTERVRVADLLHLIEEPLAGEDGIENAEIAGVLGKLRDALAAPAALAPWAEFLRSKLKVMNLGMGTLFEIFETHETPAREGVAAYDALTFRRLVASAYKRFPIITEFDGVGIEQARERFRSLDKEIIALQRLKIRSDLCHASIPNGNGVGLKKDFTNLALIRNEQGKKKRHIALRDLFDRASGAIQQMKPCMMMSPLSVATYLKPGAMTFDLIVIDEASQMPPEDAIGALVRARQCVVVGDLQQLPPTSFFQRFEDAADMEDEEESEDLQIESILDQAHNILLPPRKLRWHYRSRHQSLIAFSNKFFYDNSLTVFPSPIEEHEDFGVHLVQVNGQYADRHNLAEVRAITEWALEFMCNPTNRERSLGIVAVNQLQRDLINDEMERLFENNHSASVYRGRWENELHPFIVKNLENIQGDERDVILISTVYGRNADGRVIGNFGPISKRNGHRRLNVLFTRAREQVVLFTSLKPEDIKIRDTTMKGPRILRQYLEYALTGRLDPGNETGREPDSDFEVAVGNRLSALGYKVSYQLGVAGFFLDLAVQHPDFPGTYLVGVECDGATYHSAKSARDRDRLREEVLNKLRWKLYRVWSTDWFRDADRETEKLRMFIEQMAADRRAAVVQSQAAATHTEPQAPEEESDDEERIEYAVVKPLKSEALKDKPDVEYDDWASIPPSRIAERAQEGDQAGVEVDSIDAIEINDTVTFHFVDKTEFARTLTIVEGDSDVGADIISAHSPIGHALIGATLGEDVEIFVSGSARTAIVDEIVKAEAVTGPVLHEGKAESAGPVENWAIATNMKSDLQPSPSLEPARLPQSTSGQAPYQNWIKTEIPDPRETKIPEVADYLREIIEVEGPIRVQRAYRLYANACGINRVGRTVRSQLNKALYRLSQQKEVILEFEGPDDLQISAIARVEGAPRIVLRTGGGRDFWDVPPSELAVVLEREEEQPFADKEELYHRTIDHYGLVRLTANVHAELDRIHARYLQPGQ